MKTRNLFLTALLLMVYGALMAQPYGNGSNCKHKGHPRMHGAERIEAMVDRLAEELSLTDEQKSTIRKLHIEHFNVVQGKVAEGTRPNREVMHSYRAELHKQVKAELTDEQTLKYEAFLNRRKHHHGRHHQ